MRKRKSSQEKSFESPKQLSKPSFDNRAAKWGLLQDIIRDNSFIFSFVLTGIALLTILSTQPIRYESNDDFAMVTILSGNGGFPSSPDAIFLNPVLSYVLYLLYKISPFFPWYGISLFTIHYLGWTLILSVILRSNKGICFLFAVPLFSCLFFYHSSAISFTSASLFLAFGVFLCIVEYFIGNETSIKNIKIYFIFLASCFYLSFLFRWDLVLYSLLLFLPMIVFMKYSQIKKVLPILVTFGLVICINIGFSYLVSLNHHSYNEINKLRSEFHDTTRGEIHNGITQVAAQKVGWTYEDYLTFKVLWLIYDNYVFNTQNLRTFITENEPRKNKEYYLDNIITKIKTSYDQSKHVSMLLLISIFSIFVFRSTYLIRLNNIDWLRIIACLGTITISIIFFMYYRFAYRVYGPLYVYLFSMSFLLFNTVTSIKHEAAQNKLQRQFTIIISGAIILCGVLIGQQEIRENIHILDMSLKDKENIHQSLNSVINNNPTSYPIIIEMSAVMGLCPEYVNPLKEYCDFPRIKVFPGGWIINSPYYDMALKNLHLRDGHDFLKWLVNRKDVYLVLYVANVEAMNNVILLWKSYYFRHIISSRTLNIIPVYDFRNEKGSGLIYFQIIS